MNVSGKMAQGDQMRDWFLLVLPVQEKQVTWTE